MAQQGGGCLRHPCPLWEPEGRSLLCFQSQQLAIAHHGGQQNSMHPCHPRGRPSRKPKHLASTWPCSICCWYLRGKPVDGRSLFPSLTLAFKQNRLFLLLLLRQVVKSVTKTCNNNNKESFKTQEDHHLGLYQFSLKSESFSS